MKALTVAPFEEPTDTSPQGDGKPWRQPVRLGPAESDGDSVRHALTGHGLSGAGVRMIYGSEVIDKVLAPGSQPSQQADA